MPLNTWPWNSIEPVGPPRWRVTLCGVPASMFSNLIWNGVSAGAVKAVWVYRMFWAVMVMTCGLAGPLGAAEPLGVAPLGAAPLGPADAPPDALATGAAVGAGA